MIAKILVAVDGSDTADRALEYVGEIADGVGADIVVLSVVPPTPTSLFGGGGRRGEGLGGGMGNRQGAVERVNEYEENQEESHKKILDSATQKLRKKYPGILVTAKLGKGQVAHTIMETAKKDEVDIIVVGSRGYSGIKGWLLGSTSKQVVDECNNPILVVK